MAMTLHIGTSGWHYPHWSGTFYPWDLPREKWLAYYARYFDCVEINNSFYRLPSPVTVEHWLAETPAGFRFTLKASRYITHMKKLKDAAEPLARLTDLVRCFDGRLDVVLFQLPPRWRVNVERLAVFLDLLGDHFTAVFEFRDPSWHAEEVYALLRGHRVGLCRFDLAGTQSPAVVTADPLYLRLHGPDAAYAGSYADSELDDWAERLAAWDAKGHQVYVFFDNDQQAYAVHNALALRERVNA